MRSRTASTWSRAPFELQEARDTGVATDPTRDSQLDEVDRVLRSWRQGDCVVVPSWFVHRVDSVSPVTPAGTAAVRDGFDLAEVNVPGLVVLTQTCDIVRSCKKRPFVEASPLVEVDERDLHEIQRARRPAYAYVPGLAGRRLVADLDRVMTLEKPVLSRSPRTPGCSSDDEARAFARALARKRARPAFPDDFTELLRELQDRLSGKREKHSIETRALRTLDEIRVRATPDWAAPKVRVMLWFIRESGNSDFEGTNWADLREKWLRLIPGTDRFEVDGIVATLDRLNGEEYAYSDRLDLDHLTLTAMAGGP